jgi:hypothetical protein
MPRHAIVCVNSTLVVQPVHSGRDYDVIALTERSHVSWVPLRSDDAYPTVMTTLTESLLAGTRATVAVLPVGRCLSQLIEVLPR